MKQRTYFAKAAGTARFAYNWALDEWKKKADENKYVSEYELRKQLNAIKRKEYPWMLEVTKCAPQLAIMDLGKAFENHYKHNAGYPQYKRKWQDDSFGISNDQFQLEGKKIRIPKLGWVRLTEKLRFEGKIIGAVISRKADKWYVSIQVEMPDAEPIHTNYSESQAVGVDLGLCDLAVLSDGTKIAGAKPNKALSSRLRRLNKSLSRKTGAKKDEKKSKNFIKAKNRLARLHARIANIRNDETHKITSMLTQNYSIIGIEDLNVSGMVKNHKLARAIMDMSFFEFRRQTEYKSKDTGSIVVVSDRFYASTKICSACGEKRTEALPLSFRKWYCPACNAKHDRDINASINLKNNAVSYTVSACGELWGTISMKQELNINTG
jgi:putative transposase